MVVKRRHLFHGFTSNGWCHNLPPNGFTSNGWCHNAWVLPRDTQLDLQHMSTVNAKRTRIKGMSAKSN